MHEEGSVSLTQQRIESLVGQLNDLINYAQEVEDARSNQLNGLINFHLKNEVLFYAEVREKLSNYSKALSSWSQHRSEVQEPLQNMKSCFCELVDINASIKKMQYQRQ